MDISKSSWHYKFLKKHETHFIWDCEEKGEIDLCPYVRKLVTLMTLMSVVVGLFGGFCLYILYCIGVFLLGIAGILDNTWIINEHYTIGGLFTIAILLCIWLVYATEDENGE